MSGGEERVQLLDLLHQNGVLVVVTVNQFGDGIIRFTNLHDVDILPGAGRNLDVLPTDCVAGTLEFVPLIRSDDEHLSVLLAHPQCHALKRVGLTGTGGSEDCDVGVFVLLGKIIDENRRRVDAIRAKENAVRICQLVGGKRVSRRQIGVKDIPFGSLKQAGIAVADRKQRRKRLFTFVAALPRCQPSRGQIGGDFVDFAIQ